MELDLIEKEVFPDGGFGQNVIIFGVDMSSFVHVDNKKEDIEIIGKDQGSFDNQVLSLLMAIWPLVGGSSL